MPEEKGRLNGSVVVLGLGILLVAIIILSFFWGRYPISPPDLFKITISQISRTIQDLFRNILHIDVVFLNIEKTWSDQMESIVLRVRFPRIMLASLVGCSLSAAGASYQGVFQNPMAAPDILGAAAGAAFGAALAIFTGQSSMTIMLSAFVFGLLTVALVFLISHKTRGKQVIGLILAGIMVGSLFSAGISYIKLIADTSNQLPNITYWLMGSLNGATNNKLLLALIPMSIGLLPLLMLRWRINVLTLGDEEAKTMGINASRFRIIIIVLATLLTAASVAVTGMIGWVGLVVPHLARRLVGNNFKYLMPASMLFGASFLLLVDNISRNLTETEIPIGILTAFIGAPFFVYLITRKEESL
ncbi:MAG: iron ABC transporter permease [Dehalococcoidia bacterium]|nr:iron ABC transporter permease [Dehalococcoidia bacterium]